MRLLDPTFIRDNVDYSFGDESGKELVTGYMKVANNSNTEFMNRYWECVNNGKQYMTLFIDNIRLYKRDCIRYTACEQMYDNWKVIKADKLRHLANEDLLFLLSTLPDMKFVIFTGFEDTAIDEGIFNVIPENVLGIYASNAIVYGGKVHPVPYGLQRVLSPNDNRYDILREYMNIQIEPNNLMYINFSPGNHPMRAGLSDCYRNLPWVTIEQNNISLSQYRNYLMGIKNHKFMLCPSGNADGCECHRDWETIYMRRIPIVQDSPYLREIFKDIPILYVENIRNVTEQLLIDNNYLYEQMQLFDLNRLDYEVIYNNILKGIEHQLTNKEQIATV